MPVKFARRGYEELGDLQAVRARMHEIILKTDTGGSVCVRHEGQYTEHVFFTCHACTRDLDERFGTFSVCCDLKKDSGMKGTLVFSCFESFWEYMMQQGLADTCFYDRHVEGCAIPLVLDIDGVPFDKERFPSWRELVRKILDELHAFMMGCHHVRVCPEESGLEDRNFAVFQCPKTDKETGKEVYSLHIHAKELYLSDPNQHRELVSAFSKHLRERKL